MMRVVFYYKSNDPDIIAAKAKDNEGHLVVQNAAKAFADRFGALPVFSQGIVPHFLGVTFPKGMRQPAHPQLWSHPKPTDVRMKPKFVNVPAKLRAAAQKLSTEWNEHWPKEVAEPRESHLLEAMGLNMMTIQGNAMNYFNHNGVSWVATTIPLGSAKFEEVKASEFDHAQNEFQMEQMRGQLPQATVAQEVPAAVNDEAAVNEQGGLADSVEGTVEKGPAHD